MSEIDNARRRLMRGFFATMGAILVLLAIWSEALDLPTPVETFGGAVEGLSWASVSVAGFTFILAATAWWVADKTQTEATHVRGNCRECGARFDADFCIRCGGTRPV